MQFFSHSVVCMIAVTLMVVKLAVWRVMFPHPELFLAALSCCRLRCVIRVIYSNIQRMKISQKHHTKPFLNPSFILGFVRSTIDDHPWCRNNKTLQCAACSLICIAVLITSHISSFISADVLRAFYERGWDVPLSFLMNSTVRLDSEKTVWNESGQFNLPDRTLWPSCLITAARSEDGVSHLMFACHSQPGQPRLLSHDQGNPK